MRTYVLYKHMGCHLCDMPTALPGHGCAHDQAIASRSNRGPCQARKRDVDLAQNTTISHTTSRTATHQCDMLTHETTIFLPSPRRESCGPAGEFRTEWVLVQRLCAPRRTAQLPLGARIKKRAWIRTGRGIMFCANIWAVTCVACPRLCEGMVVRTESQSRRAQRHARATPQAAYTERSHAKRSNGQERQSSY